MYEHRIYYERNLPHYQPPGATLFVTCRLAGSIPRAVQKQLAQEAMRTQQIIDAIADPQERAARCDIEQRRSFARWESELDQADPELFWLKEPQVAGMVAKSLQYRDGVQYHLLAYSIMPNHLHLLFTPHRDAKGNYFSLAKIMHSLKLYTASEANRLLGREGQFWQHESYDHVVRDESELQRIVSYILLNPVKAGLVNRSEDWPWVYAVM
jgi:REP element-mobilizing transposase RayT